ncbi:hypothetical protein ACSYDW_07030 [Paeniglutamicibacter sp. R2-26]|uniref:hypothetical protein n=1 Tax=Paeniglutamicibacter sp. R2-26 TaxID=3144417 RepID=UPI003EE58438
MAVSETPRHKLKKYSAGSDPHPTRATFNEEADKLEAMPAIKQGSTGSRPLPGVGKVLYWDEAVKRFLYDDGTDWQDVAPIGAVTPAALAVAGDAAEGTSPRAARADHVHPLPLATSTSHGAMPKADKAKLDATTALYTPNTIPIRNADGNFEVGPNPTNGRQAVNKDYIDNTVGTYLPTGGVLARRHSTGALHVITGSNVNDAANKGYVDGYKTLWEGGMYMADGQTAPLSESVSSQKTGIILVWSAYVSGAAVNTDFTYDHIPKLHVNDFNGYGVRCHQSSGPLNGAAQTILLKYVYITNTQIIGHANNSIAPNNTRVLRTVVGY